MITVVKTKIIHSTIRPGDQRAVTAKTTSGTSAPR